MLLVCSSANLPASPYYDVKQLNEDWIYGRLNSECWEKFWDEVDRRERAPGGKTLDFVFDTLREYSDLRCFVFGCINEARLVRARRLIDECDGIG